MIDTTRPVARLPNLRIRGIHVVVGAVLIILVYLVVVPLVLLVLSGFKETGFIFDAGFTLRHFIEIYGDPRTYELILNTLVFAAGSTLVSLCLGVMFAWLTERTDLPFKTATRISLILPMAIPGVLLAIGWVLLASPRIGMINRIFVTMFGGDPLVDIFTMPGMIFVQGLSFTPTAYLIVSPSFRRMDPLLEEAAAIFGANLFRTLRHVVIPLLLPSILAAGAMVFLVSLVVFDVPGTLGMPSRIFVFSSEIFAAASAPLGAPEFGRIGALSSLFMFFTFTLALFYNYMTRRAGKFTTVTGKGYRPKLIELGRWRILALSVISFYLVLSLILPFVTLLWTSLLPFYQPFSWKALQMLSFEGYSATLSAARVQLALTNTFVVVVVTSILVAIFSTVISWLIVHSHPYARRALDLLSFFPLAIPHLMLGLALIYVYLTLRFLPIYGTVWILVIAFVTTYIAFGTRTTNAAMFQLHQELEEAARVSGASRVRAFQEIVIPLIVPAMLNVTIWVAAHSMRELSAALMLRTSQSVVISTLIWEFWAEDSETTGAAVLGIVMILMLLLLTVVGIVVFERTSTVRSSRPNRIVEPDLRDTLSVDRPSP